MADNLKDMHELMLAMMPEGATHDEDTCTICQASTDTGEDMADKTYTEAEHTAALANAVAEAVKPLEEKINAFSATQQSAEVDSKIAEVTAELTAKLEEAEAARDTAVLEAQSAKTAHDELVAYLDGVATEEAAKAEVAERRDERVGKVAEVANFPEDYVKSNADRWAGMDSEAFEALLEDYKAAGGKPAPKQDSLPPAGTALTAGREDLGSDPVKDVIRLRDRSIDPRRI